MEVRKKSCGKADTRSRCKNREREIGVTVSKRDKQEKKAENGKIRK